MISPRQWQDWVDFNRVEPFGFPVDDLRFGALRAQLAVLWGGQAKALDFMMKPPPPPSAEEVAATKRAELAEKLRAIFPGPSGTIDPAGSTPAAKL